MKRAVSIIIAIIMLLSCLTITAFSKEQDSNTISTFAEKIDILPEGEKIFNDNTPETTSGICHNPGAKEHLSGDADMDGGVSVLDATHLQRFKAYLITDDMIDLTAADADEDGQVTITDATRIQRYVAQLCNLDGSTPYLGEKLYSFGCLSDTHIRKEGNTVSTTEYWEYDPQAETDFANALTYLRDKVDFTCICGDLTFFGYYDIPAYLSIRDANKGDMPIYEVAGNHEGFTNGIDAGVGGPVSAWFEEATGSPFYYSFTESEGLSLGGDVFVMLGVDYYTEEILTQKEIDWLTEVLRENSDKRVFLFMHQRPTKDGVSGNANNTYEDGYWDSSNERLSAFEDLLYDNPNVIFFHGHTHMPLEAQELNGESFDNANIDRYFGGYSVHIPSCCASRTRKPEDKNFSQGLIVDVYKNYIVITGHDFVSKSAIPIATYCLKTG